MVEGSSSMSDAAGNLLFYTNGEKLMNRFHQVMLNGGFIYGNVSSTSNSVIAQLPGDANIYYLFTVGAAGIIDEGLRYSVIDMRGDNGKGEVVSANNDLIADSYEKLAAVRHCNNRDIWIVVRKWESDQYYAYLLTSAGIGPAPVISSTGLTIGGYSNNSLGVLKFSPNGSALAAVHSFENNGIELMDFNRATGQITNPRYFKVSDVPVVGSPTGVYGAEFSPNSRLLYISLNQSLAQPSILYQVDITAPTTTAIEASKIIISSNQPWNGGGMLLAPDNKIYYTMMDDSAMSVINKPDIAGAGCDFVFNAIQFPTSGGRRLQLGLPNFVAGSSSVLYAPYDFAAIRAGNCNVPRMSFSITRTDMDSVKWTFGDGGVSTAINPEHEYPAPGTYDVTLTIYKPDCSGNSHTLKKSVTVGTGLETVSLPEDSTACVFRPFSLRATATAEGTYLWNTGTTDDNITVTTPGLYWVDFTANGCTARDSFQFDLQVTDPVRLGNDTSVCTQPITLNAGAGRPSYLWSTGETTRLIRVNRPGEYWVKTGISNGCDVSDTINISWGDCDVYLPSAFTPNGDNRNEKFGLVNGFNYREMELLVFNRYGSIIFKSNDYSNKWDGTSKGKAQPMGVYPWTLIYRDKRNFRQTITGTVLLIR